MQLKHLLPRLAFGYFFLFLSLCEEANASCADWFFSSRPISVKQYNAAKKFWSTQRGVRATPPTEALKILEKLRTAKEFSPELLMAWYDSLIDLPELRFRAQIENIGGRKVLFSQRNTDIVTVDKKTLPNRLYIRLPKRLPNSIEELTLWTLTLRIQLENYRLEKIYYKKLRFPFFTSAQTYGFEQLHAFALADLRVYSTAALLYATAPKLIGTFLQKGIFFEAPTLPRSNRLSMGEFFQSVFWKRLQYIQDYRFNWSAFREAAEFLELAPQSSRVVDIYADQILAPNLDGHIQARLRSQQSSLLRYPLLAAALFAYVWTTDPRRGIEAVEPHTPPPPIRGMEEATSMEELVGQIQVLDPHDPRKAELLNLLLEYQLEENSILRLRIKDQMQELLR